MAKLKRALGLWEVTLCGIGVIFGAGIYVLIGKAAGAAGNAVWISFAISALIAGITGLSYAELSSKFPKSGAEYVFSFKAFGRRVGFMTGWLIFIAGVFSAATVALGFAGYINDAFGFPPMLMAVALIGALSVLLLYGVKLSAWTGILTTLIESVGLVIIILIGIPFFGKVDLLEMASGFGGVLSAAALIFFAFIGFEDITRMSEETKNPRRTIPKALILAIIISTVVYVLVAVSAVSIAGWQALGNSAAPMKDVVSAVLGPEAGTVMSVIALFSAFNTVLLILMATSRMLYGMASAGTLPRRIGWVHPKRRTPWVAIFVVGIIGAALLAFGEISFIAGITDFAIFVTFMIINLSLIKLRYSNDRTKGSFRVPISIGRIPVLPVVGVAVSLMMIYYLGVSVIVLGAVTAALGVGAYLLTKDVAVREKELALVHNMEHAMADAEKKIHKIGIALRYKKT
jgi:APA family basic amino acid/polyamine antiporter